MIIFNMLIITIPANTEIWRSNSYLSILLKYIINDIPYHY